MKGYNQGHIYRSQILLSVAVPILCGNGYFVEKHEDSQVDGEPTGRIVAVNEVQELPQHRRGRLFENQLALDAIELGDDHSWQGEFVAKRVCGIAIRLHVEGLAAAYP